MSTAATPTVMSMPAAKKVAAKKTGAVSKAKKPATKPNHPPAEMVNAAIVALKDRKGSSLQAIKKYIAANYKFDVDKQSMFIRKYLKSAVTKKTIVQTEGSGASGKFKLAVTAENEKKKVVKKPVDEKKTIAKKLVAAKPTAKKSVAVKTKVVKPKADKPKVVKAPKSPSKVKKTGKAPAAKPKAPKPKKAAAAPKAKAAAKK